MSFRCTHALALPLITAAIAVALPVAPVQAAEWYVEPKARTRLEFNDNKRLRTDSEGQGVWGVWLEALADVGVRTEVSELETRLRVTDTHYPGDNELNTTEYFVDLSASHQSDERNRFGLSVNVALDSTLTSDFLVGGNRQDTVTGRNYIAIAPSWSHVFDAKNTLELGASWSQAKYDDAQRYGLSEYQYNTLSATWIHQLSPRWQLLGQGSFTRYDLLQDRSITGGSFVAPPPAIFPGVLNPVVIATQDPSDTLTLLGGFGYAVNEYSSLSVLVGAARTTSSRTEQQAYQTIADGSINVPVGATPVTRDTSEVGYRFDITYDENYERGVFSLQANRSEQPNSVGDLQTRTGLDGSLSHRFNERWGLDVDSGIFTDDQGATKRDAAFLATTARYRVERNFYVKGTYRFRYQKLNNAADSAISNALMLTAEYAWDRQSWSR